MVQNNHKDRQSLSKKIINEKPKKVKTYKGDLRNWGIPLTIIPKKGNSSGKKNRDNKIRQERGLTNPQQKKNDCLAKIGYQHPNHHRKIRAKTQTRSNV